ncbi:MAG: fused MFS/spermidine synthase, partial [Verrucomicrobiales bacterium]|nr:fused MFS/spermidine synthase [Verrucomicrobiales bacterium]
SRRSARFYSINSLGAVCGAGLAGFVLVLQLGLLASLQATALLNVVVGIVAVALARQTPTAPESVKTEPTGQSTATPLDAPSANKLARWACLLVALTGAISMGLEVLAARSLALIVGPSSQAFALVLMAFILGIGIGSAIIASPRWRKGFDEVTVARLLLAAGVAVGVYVLSIQEWVQFYSTARSGLAGNAVGFLYHQAVVGFMAMIVLGVPAGLLGAVLPLSIRLIGGTSSALAGQVGRLLTWNTIGAVLGVLFTGFILMPSAGMRAALIVMAMMLLLAAALAAWLGQARTFAAVALLWGIGFTGFAARTGEGWQQVLGSGVFRLRTMLTPQGLELRRKFIKMLFYKDSADATVAVETALQGKQKDELVLRINGKQEASTKGDLATQSLLAHLPMLARPESKEVFVLGFGSGITAGALLGHPVERITIAENCRPVLEAARLFEPWNRGVLTNARTRVLNEDARTVLKLDPQKYDIIISEPSNPWVVGIGSVFSREFYELAARQLKEGGLIAQWFHVYEVHDNLVMLVLRTFQSVFPDVEIWESQLGDLILLGSRTPWHSSVDTFKKVYERPEPRADLQRIGLRTPESVFIRQVASQRICFAIAGEGPVQSDFFPILEYAAPKAFFMGISAVQVYLFDERTWQSAFVTDEKRKALLGLPEDILGKSFLEFGTGSADLQQYLIWRAEQAARPEKEKVYMSNPYAPIIFRDPASYPRQLVLPQGTSAELTQITRALELIYTEPAHAKEAVEIIEGILRTHAAAAGNVPAPDWKPGFYAAVAAKVRLSMLDLEGARRIVAETLKIEPDDVQLQFLRRLMANATVTNEPRP